MARKLALVCFWEEGGSLRVAVYVVVERCMRDGQRGLAEMHKKGGLAGMFF